MTAEESLVRLSIELPPAPKAAGLYKPLFVQDGLAYFSGHLPLLPDGGMITGKVGENLGVEEGARAARLQVVARKTFEASQRGATPSGRISPHRGACRGDTMGMDSWPAPKAFVQSRWTKKGCHLRAVQISPQYQTPRGMSESLQHTFPFRPE